MEAFVVLYHAKREKTMKRMIRQLSRIAFTGLFVVHNLPAQEACDPQYSIFNFQVVNGAAYGTSPENKVQWNVMGPLAGATPQYQSDNSMATGFWGYYLTEPFAPLVVASDGDYDDRIEVSWNLIDDNTGPPITGNLASVFRNGSLLTTVPISQTTYQDFNVFPGEFYNYEVVVENALGQSYTSGDVGFLNPNGLILGSVKTMNQVPVPDVEVRLTPNLGLALEFDGTQDFVVFDSLVTLPVDTTFTLEGWFRAYPDPVKQTMFAGTGIGHLSDNLYLWLGLNELGQVLFQHQATAGDGVVDELVSLASYNDLEWHHVAAVHDSIGLTLYVDGDPVDVLATSAPITASMNLVFGKRAPRSNLDYFHGRLDDFRFWTVARTQEEIRLSDQMTLNGEEPGIYAYWKFDEVLGDKIFDLTSNNIDGNICGLERTELHAPVFVSGLTDEQGNYAIKGIYYGSGITFTVTPSKDTPIGTSLAFDGIDDYIDFPYLRLDLTAGYTLEGWFQTAATIDQTLFAAVDPALNADHVIISMNAAGGLDYIHGSSIITSSNTFNDEFWHHWAVTHDGNSMILYVDGNVEATAVDTGFIPVLSEFVLGKRSPAAGDGQFFQGKLDEFRVWDNARNEAQIEGTMMQVLNGDEAGLAAYWKFNEGFGEVVVDNGSQGLNGTLHNSVAATWSEDIPLDEYFSHYFDIESRQATLNPSNTSVDRVDFTDLATVSATGFVQFEGTGCFSEGVELLVDGEPAFPPIITDATGRFLAEFEPGRSGARLTPVLEGHEFIPPFIDLPTLNAPLSGLYFTDTKKNNISGKVVGGLCEFPITPTQGQIEVTIASVTGCIDTTVVPDPNTGQFLVEGLPPLIYNVSVDHPDPAIDQYFTGDTVSLVDGDASIAFVYRSSPEITISGFNTDSCGLRIINELETYLLSFNIYESYNNAGTINTCAVDTGYVTVSDFIGDASDSTFMFVNGYAEWQHRAGYPNILGGTDHPYEKNIQVVAEVAETGETVTATEWAIVLGNRPRNSVFTTTTPEIPVMILRDPPGNASYSYYTTENANSYSTSFQSSTNFTNGGSATIHMGSEWIISAGAWGIPDVKIEFEMDLTASMSVSQTQSNYFEQNWTFTTTEAFSTSDDAAVVGEGGDLFIGGAMNLLYGITDVLRIGDQCQPEVVEDILVSPNGFATNYVYTQSHIVGTLIPSLWAVGDTASAEMWEQIIQRNNTLKEAAAFSQNISFDGGAGGYEYTESTEISETMTVDFEIAVDAGVALAVGMQINKFGVSGEVYTNMSMTTGQSETSSNTQTNTFGYVLDDTDAGDFFSVNVYTDNVYGSPVFELISGASSCPWEPNTAPREDVTMSMDQYTAINVPPDEPAVFTLYLGNTSQTNEDGIFDLQVLQDTNPDGAGISVNGVDFEDSFPIFLLAGQQTAVTLTVDRGPNAYVYNDIGLRLVSSCEFDLWLARGDATAPIPLSDSVFFSVEYIEPCTEVAIAVPENNWLVTGDSAEDSLWVTVTGYDRFDPEFTHLELQYRQSTAANGAGNGTGSQSRLARFNDDTFGAVEVKRLMDLEPEAVNRRATPPVENDPGVINPYLTNASSGEPGNDGSRDNDWFIARTVLKDSLTDDFVLIPWNIHPDIIPDGAYELRTVAVCNAGLYPGISPIITGIIDRNPPVVVGQPSPVDGILGQDDLISLTFNEAIDCESINPGAGDIQLINTVTGNPVDFTYTCGGNEIFIEPNIQNQYIENQILRATVTNVSDVYGNLKADPIEWEFFVNRNPIEWAGGDISDIVIYDDEIFYQERQLVNNGGSPRSFDMVNIPAWLSVSPLSGTIQPGSAITVTLTLAPGVGAGIYQETIFASGTMGDEPLLIDMRVLCHEPLWSLSPSEFQYSMNMIASLAVDDIQSEDVYDMVGVFVEDEIRGVANVQFVPDLGSYEVFLTIYSNVSQGENLSFKVWDASNCVNYGFVLEAYTFEANSVQGTLSDPVTLTATNQLIQSRSLPAGWTWFSLNLESSDMSVNSVLNSLSPGSGDLVKSQTSFSQYVESAGWVGGLDSLDNVSMYQIKIAENDSLDLLGFPVNVDLTPIAIAPGWNWVSYQPQTSLEINQALVSLDAITGDLIKSQFGFAQYLENVGWLGSLTFMTPHLGYLLKSENGGTLIYPAELPPTVAPSDSVVEPMPSTENMPDWMVAASDYEFNMTLTAEFSQDGQDITGDGYMLGAFTVNEAGLEIVRGVARSDYIESIDKTYFFMMIYGNGVPGETIYFKLYDSHLDVVMPVNEMIDFASDTTLGDLVNPYPLSNQVLGIGDNGFVPDQYSLSQNYPNPFNPVTRFGFGLPEDSDVRIRIYNLRGEYVRTLVNERRAAGYYFVQWDAKDDRGRQLPSGMYLTVLESGSFRSVKKMILLK